VSHMSIFGRRTGDNRKIPEKSVKVASVRSKPQKTYGKQCLHAFPAVRSRPLRAEPGQDQGWTRAGPGQDRGRTGAGPGRAGLAVQRLTAQGRAARGACVVPPSACGPGCGGDRPDDRGSRAKNGDFFVYKG
jgi:hypothetical protein